MPFATFHLSLGTAVPMTANETLRILIVDDEAALRRGMERVLRDFSIALPGDRGQRVSFAIEHASSAEQALEAIEQAPPDVLLLDYKLPGLSGLEMLERIAALYDGDVAVESEPNVGTAFTVHLKRHVVPDPTAS
jgi:CheY-like chemotaxis protein